MACFLGSSACPAGLCEAAAMLAFVIASALAGQLVSYVDEQGTTHYVDAPSKIPAKYRKKAKPLEGEVGTVEQQKPKDTRQPNSVQIEPASIREQQKEQQRLREQQNRANAKPAAVDANSPEERRRRWEEAKTRGGAHGGRREVHGCRRAQTGGELSPMGSVLRRSSRVLLEQLQRQDVQVRVTTQSVIRGPWSRGVGPGSSSSRRSSSPAWRCSPGICRKTSPRSSCR